jgi:gluconokinase
LKHPHILGIDIGTSSVRAALYDLKGNMLPQTLVRNERQLTQLAGGGSEINAEKALFQFVRTVDDLLERSRHIDGPITHVATACFWHSLVGIDALGKATTSVLSWADNRSREQASFLRKKFVESEIHQRTGARFHSSYWPAKLTWLRKAQPDRFAITRRWLSLSDHLALKLFGHESTSISMASATGLFDIRKCSWDDELTRVLKIKLSHLPTMAGERQTFRLNKRFARRWPRLAEAEWFPAIGDGAANNIGSGCVENRSRATLMVGTSAAMRVAYRGEPPKKIPDGLWCYRIDRERVVIGGALSDGGGLYQWLKENLQLPANAERIMAKRTPTAHGLTFLPFVWGERSPGYNENARGAIWGLTASTDAVDVAQAAMESVGYRFAEILEQLSEIAVVKEIFASGGALRASKVWTQIMADVLGQKIVFVDEPEASLRGVVLLALQSIGNIENIEKTTPGRGRVFEPAADRHAIYRRARKQHQKLYDLMMNA